MANHIRSEVVPATQPPQAALSVSKMFDKIRANPKGSWSISNIETACAQLGLICKPPTRGSHYKVSSDHLPGILTIPAARPIKTPYIKLFLSLAEAHVAALLEKGETHG